MNDRDDTDMVTKLLASALAQKYLDDARTQFGAEKFVEALRSLRKAMDAFPPLDKESMHKAYLFLRTAIDEAKKPASSWGTLITPKPVQIETLKATIRKLLYELKSGGAPDAIDPVGDMHIKLRGLEALYEPREKHPELLVNLAEALIEVKAYENAREFLDDALILGADPKKVHFTTMCMYAQQCWTTDLDEEYEQARLLARNYVDVFLAAARKDPEAGAYAWPFIEKVMDMKPLADGGDSQPQPSQ